MKTYIDEQKEFINDMNVDDPQEVNDFLRRLDLGMSIGFLLPYEFNEIFNYFDKVLKRKVNNEHLEMIGSHLIQLKEVF